jgi:dTDP-4-amino-4,6-dideoxygalactose transaminase
MEYRIPLFDLNFGPEEETAILETVRSKWISMGPKTQEFEKAFAGMLGIRYAVAVTNCTAALHLAMIALGISEGDEVLCPSLTFVATANAIRYVGARPVFCDIGSSEDLTVDPEDLIARITPRTKAIVVVHYGGFPCSMARILDIARTHKLRVIEDASHAPLSEDESGQKMGTLGDIGCFSFFSNKNISTGEGGMLVTRDEGLFRAAHLLRSHGMTSLSYQRAKGHSTDYDVIGLGYNYRIDDLRSSLGLVQLRKLSADLALRAGRRRRYLNELGDCGGLIIPFRGCRSFVSNYIFPVVLKGADRGRRDRVRLRLAQAGVQTSVHYPSVHRFSIYRNDSADLPKTESVSDAQITLPMYARLSDPQIGEICAALKTSIREEP